MRSLADLCVSAIAQHILDIETCQIIEALEDEQREAFEKLLPPDLPPDIALALNLDEDYWEHRCKDRWKAFDKCFHKDSWRTLFIHCHVEEIVDGVSSSSIISDVLNSVAPFKDDIYKLNIKGLPLVCSQDTFGQKITPGTFVGRLISLFTNVQRLKLNVMPQNCGLMFDFDKFNLSDDDYDFILDSILQKTTLKSFAFTCPSISSQKASQMLENLAMLDNLTELNISCSMLTDDTAMSITKLLTSIPLENLILCNNSICDTGATTLSSVLGNNCFLKLLDLSRNCIGNSGAVHIFESLVGNKTLEQLFMKENSFGEEAGKALVNLLGCSSSLKYMSFSGNKLKKTVGKMLADALKKNKTVLYLDARFCELDDDDFRAIQKNIERNLDNCVTY